jgi:hypothetical protein
LLHVGCAASRRYPRYGARGSLIITEPKAEKFNDSEAAAFFQEAEQIYLELTDKAKALLKKRL